MGLGRVLAGASVRAHGRVQWSRRSRPPMRPTDPEIGGGRGPRNPTWSRSPRRSSSHVSDAGSVSSVQTRLPHRSRFDPRDRQRAPAPQWQRSLPARLSTDSPTGRPDGRTPGRSSVMRALWRDGQPDLRRHPRRPRFRLRERVALLFRRRCAVVCLESAPGSRTKVSMVSLGTNP